MHREPIANLASLSRKAVLRYLVDLLFARRDELEAVAQAGGHELAGDLVRTAAKFERAGLKVAHLRSWATVIAA